MKKILYITLTLAVASSLFSSCKESWLDPKPLSFFTPENTYVDADGLYAAITACERNLRHEFFGDGAPILTEMYTSDICVHGKTDESASLVDFDTQLIPSHVTSDMKGKVKYYWDEGYKGIKYANIAINRIDMATYSSEAERNAVLGNAYFHKAYRYYRLVHQFGDVPWLETEITEPKLDFYTYDRWSILEQIKKDMEFAYEWANVEEPRGRANKWSCGALLMKIYMSLGEFDNAIKVGQEIVANNPLMQSTFTGTAAHTNIMLDLHSVEGKMSPSNTEGLMYVVNIANVAQDQERSYTMRNALPYWAKGASIRTPDGKSGTQNEPVAADKGTYLDNDFFYGRGIGTCRPTNYYQSDIWTEKEANDMRGPNNRDNWKRMEDLYYNHSGLRGKSEWYGQHLVRPANLAVADSIRCWYKWPHYKVFVPDPTRTGDRQGGETPWYVYRTAEIYLMLAECYYWKGDSANAAANLNVVRERAGAEPLSGSIGIKEVLDERARELYYEEPRHTELVRISYLYAKLGKACEEFGGRVYKLENFSGPEFSGTGNYCKDEGYNFWFDWISKYNNFFNKGIVIPNGEYKISVHHVLWPVPENAIKTNTGGVINQTAGYPHIAENITPLKVGETAPATAAI